MATYQEPCNVLGYQAHTRLIRQASRTNSVRRLNSRYGDDSLVTRTMTRIGSRPAPLRTNIDLADDGQVYVIEEVPPLANSQTPVEEEMKNLEARMQQDMVHRGQAIAAGDATKEKQADTRLAAGFTRIAQAHPLGEGEGKKTFDKAAVTMLTKKRSKKDHLLSVFAKKVATHGLTHAIIGGSLLTGLSVLANHFMGTLIPIEDANGNIIDVQATTIQNADGTTTALWDDHNDGDFLLDTQADIVAGADGVLVYANAQPIDRSSLQEMALDQGGAPLGNFVDGVGQVVSEIFNWF